MIPAYIAKELKHHAVDLDEYSKRTTIATIPREVRAYLRKYLNDNLCNIEVKAFINSYLKNFRALSKTHIVRDGSYRNCVILIRPDGLMETRGNFGKLENIEEYVNHCIEKSEVIFLNMTSETWEDVRMFMQMLDF